MLSNNSQVYKVLLRSFVFELHAEKEKLIGNMDLPTAIAALLHLAFVVNLKYPKVSFA
jgi:hypothetical protein